MIKPQDINLGIDSWREGQLEAVLNSITSKKRYTVHSMPCGGGKSHVMMAEALLTGQRTLILVGSKEQQNQWGRLFKHLKPVDIRGKSNYSCRASDIGGEHYDGSSVKMVNQGLCQFDVDCSLKLNGCLYYDLVRKASQASLVIANYAAGITARMYTEGWGYFPLVICDEAHEIQEWLTNCLSINLPNKCKHVVEKDYPESLDPVIWADWAIEAQLSVKSNLKELLSLPPRKRRSKELLEQIGSLRELDRTLGRLRSIKEDWLVTGTPKHVLFQPINVHRYAEPLVFGGAEKVIFASGTVQPYHINALGIHSNRFDFFEYPSTFPIERRPVYYYPVVKMKHDMDAEDELECLNTIDEFISKRLDRKGFIPTVSFARAQKIASHSQYREYMVLHPPTGSTAALQKFKAMKPPAILVSPSIGTGVDLPMSLCEYTIIPKMPFEWQEEPLIQARCEKNPTHGIARAIEKLVQYIGRAMRSRTDQNESIILDAMFGMIVTRYYKMIPNWVKEVIVPVNQLPEPPYKL